MASKKTNIKKTSPKSFTAASLNKKLVKELKEICAERGIECKGTKSTIIAAILSEYSDAKEIKVRTKSPSKKKSPIRKSKSPKRGRSKSPKRKSPAKRKSPLKCKSTEVKEVTAKKCVTKLKSGLPAGSAALKKKYGDDYVFDEDLGVVGRSADVEEYRKSFRKSPTKKSPVKKRKSPAKKSPVKKTKTIKIRTCIDKEDPLLCEEDEYCSATSSKAAKCVKGPAKGDKAELNVDGRIIVGLPKVIENLQKILGGTITLPDSKKKTKQLSPIGSGDRLKKSSKRLFKGSPKGKIIKKASPDIYDLPLRGFSEDEDSSIEIIPAPTLRGKGSKGLGKRAKTPPKKKTPPKRTKTPPKKKTPPKRKSPIKVKTPQTPRSIEKRLEELAEEEAASPGEIKRLKEKLSKLKTKGKGDKKESTKTVAPARVQMKAQEIYKTFEECLKGLNA